MFELVNKARKDDPKARATLELIEIDDTATPLVEKVRKFHSLKVIVATQLWQNGTIRGQLFDDH